MSEHKLPRRSSANDYYVCEVDDHDRAHVIAGPMAKAKAESQCRAYDADPNGPTTFATDGAGLMVLQAADGHISAIFGPKGGKLA